MESTSETLLKGRLKKVGAGEYELAIENQIVTSELTAWEILLLTREHGKWGVKTVNKERATQVKHLMERGRTQAQIVYLLGFQGFGEAMVKRDHRALTLAKQ